MSYTVLWVEDDADDVFLIGRAIQKTGLNPLQLARDGKEAVDYLTGTGAYANREAYPFPTLVLLDLKLPKMSGFEVLQWSWKQPEVCRIPVIIFTSSRERSDIDRAYELGANAYLLKSVDHANLVEALKRVHAFWLELNMRPTLPVHVVAARDPGLSGQPA